MKANNIKPEDPIDWDMEHKYTGPNKSDRDKRLELTVRDDDMESKAEKADKKPAAKKEKNRVSQ